MPNEDDMDRGSRPSGTGGPGSPTRHSRLRRIWQIGLEFSKFGLWVAWHRGLMRCDTHPVAERFVLVLQRLGTTFVKLGQHLSLRTDLLPEDAQRVLARLQTHAAPFPAEDAVREIESAFGGPWQRAFARLEMVPLAAASIAQIHRATLPDGREVIVKIRRPGAAAQAQADMRILRTIARTVNRVVPPLRRWGLVAVVDEIAANLDLEMDLARESRFVRRFADAWRGSAEIDIPDVIDGLCTPTVMVQRFSSGTLLDELSPDARAPAARRLVDSYVTQIFRDGLFHGDPHPGNVFAMADGRLCLHDFGIVGRVDRRMRWALAAFALAFVEHVVVEALPHLVAPLEDLGHQVVEVGGRRIGDGRGGGTQRQQAGEQQRTGQTGRCGHAVGSGAEHDIRRAARAGCILSRCPRPRPRRGGFRQHRRRRDGGNGHAVVATLALSVRPRHRPRWHAPRTVFEE